MSSIVCKFGGSSVSNAAMFAQVRQIIRSDPARKYIVLSAPGKRWAEDEKITDLFYRAHEGSLLGDYSILPRIRERYAAIRDALAPDFDLEGEFRQIRAQLHLSADFAASRGEYLCARLFAAYTDIPFVDAAELIFFDSCGKIDFERSCAAVQTHLKPLKRAVVPGFYGLDADGRIKTLSRGGSDVTGALLSAILDADLYENWTDVKGLFTADPHIIPDARRNRTVSFEQMKQIALAGAQLLHPDALEPLEGKKIDVLLKNTFHPAAPGTRISERFMNRVPCVTGHRLSEFSKQNSTPLAAICAFGMNDAQLAELNVLLNPIQIIHMHGYIQIIVLESEYEADIRIVHGLLTETGSGG